MMSSPRKKASIDCTGYRCEMDKNVDLIIAGEYDNDEEVIWRFVKIQERQEKMWLKWRAWCEAREEAAENGDSLPPWQDFEYP